MTKCCVTCLNDREENSIYCKDCIKNQELHCDWIKQKIKCVEGMKKENNSFWNRIFGRRTYYFGEFE